MADDKVALEIFIEADKAQMSLGQLEEGYKGLREQLEATDRSTEEGRAKFKKLATQMAGTSKEIKNMELSFEGLDREQVASEIGSVAGAVGDLTTSFILLGGENETMEEVGRNIEKAMMVSMGLKGAIEGLSSARKLYNNLLEDGTIEQVKETIATSIATAKTWLLDAAKKAYATTTGVLTGKVKIATIAQKIFNAVLKANPIALIITAIAAAGAAYLAFAEDTSEARKQQQALQDSLEAVSGELESVYEEVNKVENAFALAKKGVISKEEALSTYNETIGQTIGQADTLEEAEQNFSDNTEAYVKAATLRAQAQELIKMAAKEQTDALLASEEDNRAWYENVSGFWTDAGAAVADYSTLGIFELGEASDKFNEKLKEGATERLVNEKEANADRYKELAKSLNEELALIETNNNFITETAKKAAADARKLSEDLTAHDLEQAQKRKEEREKASAERKAQREKDKAADEKAAAEQKKIDEKAAADAIQLEKDKNQLLEDLEAKAIEDKTTRALAELEIAQERERQQLIEKFGEDTELLLALTTEQELAMVTLIADIEQEARENKATLDQEARDKELEADQKALDDKRAQREKDFALASSAIGALSALNDAALSTDLLNAAGNDEKQEEIRRSSFERQKKLNIAMAAINGAQAVIAGFAQGGLPMAVLAGVTAAAQLAAIVATTYQSSASPTEVEETVPTPDGAGGGGGGVQLSPVTNTSTILGNQQVFVTETDITNTQNNVSVIEESATF